MGKLFGTDGIRGVAREPQLDSKTIFAVESSAVAKFLIKEGGELKLVNVPRLVHNVLVVHRLLSAFEIHSDEEESLASFK